MNSISAAISANRFGLGARPGDLKHIGKDGTDWLLSQLRKNPFPAELKDLPGGAERAKSKGRDMMKGPKKFAEIRRENAKHYRKVEVFARLNAFVRSDSSFTERLVAFWSNHFCVSIKKPRIAGLVGPFEREAIRPNINRRFEDLLIGVCKHPAMLVYLDNAQSIGPNSRAGRRRAKGLNENLAREILELHTLGVGGGYTQEDIIEFAKMLTGWTIDRSGTKKYQNGFLFAQARHEPGPKRFMGGRYKEEGLGEAERALRYIARHPSTARFIAEKLVRHFISDSPPASDVEKVAKVFSARGGDLFYVTKAVIELKGAQDTELRKIKTPYELIVSCMRATGVELPKKRTLAAFQLLGQVPFTAPSPAGWSDVAQDWLGPEAMMNRLEFCQAFAKQSPRSIKPAQLASEILGELLSNNTLSWIKRAPSPSDALALLLASPEFQRR